MKNKALTRNRPSLLVTDQTPAVDKIDSDLFSRSQCIDPFKKRVKPGFDSSSTPSVDWFGHSRDTLAQKSIEKPKITNFVS
jgi:hypothetical protein